MIESAPRVLIELRPSAIDGGGIGVFAVRNIMKDQKVADGIHEEDYEEMIPWVRFGTFDADVQKKIMDFCIGTPEGFIPPEGLDFNKLSVEWYLNHSCEGNCGFNDEGDFVAIKDVCRGDELTYDYGLAESNPKFIMTCTCGSGKCRKTITGNDWKEQGFRAKNQEHMLPHLR
jgi:hypothetical protein